MRTVSMMVLVAIMIMPGMAKSDEYSQAQKGGAIGGLVGGLVGSLVGPAKNREQNALIGAGIAGLIGYTAGNELDKRKPASSRNPSPQPYYRSHPGYRNYDPYPRGYRSTDWSYRRVVPVHR